MNKRFGLLALASGVALSALWAGAQVLAARTPLASGRPPAPVGTPPGPARVALQLFLYPASDPATVVTRTTTADSNGHYQTLWSPGLDLRPQDSGYVRYAPDSRSRAYAGFVAPFLLAQVGGYGLAGLAAPLSPVWVTVTTPAGAVLGSGTNWTSVSGSFLICYGDCQYTVGIPGNAAGDRVWASAAGQTFSMTLPAITAHRAGNVIAGQAPPGPAVTVARFPGPAPYLGNADAPNAQAPF